jgi:hypothetical protein
MCHQSTAPVVTSRSVGNRLIRLLRAVGLCCATAMALRAADATTGTLWWGACDLGAGQVHRSLPGASSDRTQFYLALSGGVELDPHFLLGAELSGWLGQGGDVNDPSKGSGISQIFAIARIYPQAHAPFHLLLGAGALTAWDNSPGSSSHHGTGWEVGVGYDLRTDGRGAFSPFLRFGGGKAGKLSLSTATLGVGYTWR